MCAFSQMFLLSMAFISSNEVDQLTGSSHFNVKSLLPVNWL